MTDSGRASCVSGPVRPLDATDLDQRQQLASWAKALGHPARVQIVHLLLNHQGCFCGDIVDHLDLAQSTVSQHLKLLKTAGLIRGTIDGPRVCYCVDPQVLANFAAGIAQLASSAAPVEPGSC